MKTRLLIFAATVALVATACGTDTGTTTVAPATTRPGANSSAVSVSPTGPMIDAGVLTYAYADVDTVEYAVSIEQTVVMHADGDATTFAGSTDLPLDAELHTTVDSTLRYETSPGPEPGTTTIHLVADTSTPTIEGTINGEPADATAADQLGVGDIPPVDVTVTVDEHGKIVDASAEGTGDLAGALGGGFGNLEGLGADQLRRPIGPAFPDEPIGVGDSWTDTQEVEGPDGPISTKATHTVVGTDTVAGHDVFVIKSVYETEGFQIDFTDFLRGFFEGFADLGGDATGDATTSLPPDVAEVLDELEFVIVVEPSTSDVTSYFDPEEQLIVAADAQAKGVVSMRFRGPDETTGDLVSFQADIDLDQLVSYELVGPAA